MLLFYCMNIHIILNVLCKIYKFYLSIYTIFVYYGFINQSLFHVHNIYVYYDIPKLKILNKNVLILQLNR